MPTTVADLEAAAPAKQARAARAKRAPFTIGRHEIEAGSGRTVHLPVSKLADHTPVNLAVRVVHGSKAGPVLFVAAAIHGDEVIGVEIVRRLLTSPALARMRGTLLAVPIVNAYGFANLERYLPDRRDLNRVFPGSPRGSLAGRLAHLFFNEIVQRSDLGIDLHSGALHRTNLPQLRVTHDRAEATQLADAFGAPVTLTSKLREGSLRGAAADAGVEVLLYEAGEALRFDEVAVRAGVSGILRVMGHMRMLPVRKASRKTIPTIHSPGSKWLRAPAGGMLRPHRTIGDHVAEGELLGTISGPFGGDEVPVVAGEPGLVIGRTNLPVVNEGDGIFHIARLTGDVDAEARIEDMTERLALESPDEEEEII